MVMFPPPADALPEVALDLPLAETFPVVAVPPLEMFPVLMNVVPLWS